VLATKFARPMDAAGRFEGASRRYIMSEVEASLRRLRTDWIDLYQQHQPDPLTPIEETLRALDDLVRQGKVRYIGCSTLPAWQVVEAQWTAMHLGLHHFISCQEEYGLLARDLERDMLPVMESYGLGLIPFRPLADGLLTGKYKRGMPPPPGSRLATTARAAQRNLTDGNWAIVERLEGFATEHGHTLLELALSWLARRPTVASVIAGATKPEQVEQNVRAVGWALTQEEMQEIDRLTVR
jgi:aryl-alcohol dehydrogenase-like predicted oxidoreductase